MFNYNSKALNGTHFRADTYNMLDHVILLNIQMHATQKRCRAVRSDVKQGQNLEAETETEARALRSRPRPITWGLGRGQLLEVEANAEAKE